MKRVVWVMMIVGAAVPAWAQSGTAVAPVPVPERRLVVGLEGSQAPLNIVRPVEARITKGAPYSGDAVTEFTQVLGDGNRIQRKTVTRTFRDSEGRTRRETTNTVNGVEKVSVTIVDPVGGASWVLDPEARTAVQSRSFVAAGAGGRGAGAVEGVPGPRGGGGGGGAGGRGGAVALPSTAPPTVSGTAVTRARVAEGDDQPAREELGQKSIEGVMADGSRTTTTIAAGKIGNAQAIKIVSEQWFSPDLQVLLMTRHSDPRTGETVYRLTNIVRGEQDRSLFEVPADYTIQDRRQP
jgi:hypothetical protein